MTKRSILSLLVLTLLNWFQVSALAADGQLLKGSVASVIHAETKEALVSSLAKIESSGVASVVLNLGIPTAVQTELLQQADFKGRDVTALQLSFDVWSPVSAELNRALVQTAERHSADLWVIDSGEADKPEQVVARLQALVIEARKAKVNVVLLPNQYSIIPTAADVHQLVRENGLQDVGIAIDWNEEVAMETASSLAVRLMDFVEGVQAVIVPVDAEVRPLIKALARAGYDGPVVLDTQEKTKLAEWSELNTGLPNAFGAFDMGSLGKMKPAEQTQLLTSLGYEATVATGWRNIKLNYIIEYLESPQVTNGGIQLPVVIWTPAVTQEYPSKQKMDRLLQALQKHDAQLWVKGRGPKEDYAKAPAFFQRVADDAVAYGVDVVLYPHHNTTYLDAEEAYELWQKVDRPNVRISMHMCHELKASNDERIAEIVAEVAPYLEFVTVSGADSTMNRQNGDWKKTIMPLDEGDISNVPFVRALYQHGYTGPIFLHTYGVDVPAEDHLKRSIDAWRQIELEAVKGL